MKFFLQLISILFIFSYAFADNFTQKFLDGARIDVKNKTTYISKYHRGGYPPEGEGVCTDVIWRAFKNAGVDLKSFVDKDIRENISKYPRVNNKPEPNIDFRRVPNLIVFFKRHSENLDIHVKSNRKENIELWQPGDIVTFTNSDHIAILSDKRNWKGIPYLIHNDGPYASEDNEFMSWYDRGITGHFRLKNNFLKGK